MRTLAVFAFAACSGGGGGGDAGQQVDAPTQDDGQQQGVGLSEQYPGDNGIAGDPAVIWFEDFEAASVAAITGRYDQAQGVARMALTSDAPKGNALAMTSGGAVSAVDLYKRLPDHDDVFVRWYAKYDANIRWHHSGMWIGGYNPGMTFPSPMAGRRPVGNDRFSIALEPVWGSGTASARFDFYNYWMGMQSWMLPPVNDNGTAYYGNSLVHRNSFTIDENQWVCLEVHVRLNPSATTAAGAVLEVWKNDALVTRLDDAGPMGYWLRGKWCASNSDGQECTDYPAQPDEILSLQFRNTTAFGVNAFWPQNYITESIMGTLRFDQMVVATTRVGCMR
ncbi:MAG: hypothetical protein ACKV2T_02530 [Kofleriaceae bacterium]